MSLKEKSIITLACLVMVFGVASLYADEKYPTREIELLIPWSPGGPTDIIGRIFANELTKYLKVPVIPTNKAGGTATIGAAYVVKARKDGYTTMVGSLGWLVGSTVLEDIPYDPLKDFIPIANISMTPACIFVKADSSFRTLEDLIDKAKKNPKIVSCGTGGTASDGTFNLHILQKAAGIEFNFVPFKGGGDIPAAVLGGHVDFGVNPVSAVISFVRAGNMRILAIGGSSRIKDLPDVPTFSERGFKQPYLNNWNGLFAPTGIPQFAIDTLSLASEKAIKSKEMASTLDRVASTVEYVTGGDYRRRVEDERNIIERIAYDTGLKQKK